MDLSTKIAGIKLRNPFMNASGVLSSTPETLKRLEKNGFGALVTKSLTKKPKSGNTNPVCVDYTPDCFINKMGLPNPGVCNFVEELKEYEFNIPIIGSVTGSSVEEFLYVAKELESSPAVKLLEINISCPNTDGDIICFEKDYLYGILKALDKEIDTSYSVKLSPFTNFKDLIKTIEIINQSEASALTLTNTIPVRVELIPEFEIPIDGGQSGKSILGLSLRNVYEASRCTDLDIIGVGGISGPNDAISYIHNGAKALQVGTHLKHGMLELIIPNMKRGIIEYMQNKGYKSLEDFRNIY